MFYEHIEVYSPVKDLESMLAIVKKVILLIYTVREDCTLPLSERYDAVVMARITLYTEKATNVFICALIKSYLAYNNQFPDLTRGSQLSDILVKHPYASTRLYLASEYH